MRKLMIASALVLMCSLGFQTSVAQAQWGGYFGGRSGRMFIGNGGYGAGYGGYNGYFPNNSYYGNGGHDFQPHWHATQTPYGTQAWYGNGPHDVVPHQHSQTPWSYQGYSNTGVGPTTSYYSPQPYYVAPW